MFNFLKRKKPLSRQQAINEMNASLFNAIGAVSAKRLQLLGMHEELIKFIEPTLFTFLGETQNNLLKGTFTKLYSDYIVQINGEVTNHRQMIAQYEEVLAKAIELNNNIQNNPSYEHNI